MGGPTADLRQKVGTADHLIQRPRTEFGKNLPHLGGIEGDQVYNLVGIAGELGPQTFVLRADTNRACVRLTLAHHDAAHRNQCGGADAVFLGPHHRSHDNVPTRSQTTVGAKRHTLPQIVHCKNLVRLRQTHFPRKTRIFDRRRRGRTRTTIVAGDQDHIRFRLCHASRNCANARRRNQLHRHLTARVDLLEVVDELRQILDRINVVVRRWGDQRHAFGRMAQAGDQVRDLHPWQLATLTGLRTLGNFDLKLFTLVEVFGGHTKPARSNLFDLRRWVVAVWLWMEVCRIFAAFAGIRLRPNPVHRHVQRLMRLRAQCAQRHARCDEALADRSDAFHLFNRHGRAKGFDRQQVPQMDRRVVLHLLGILLPQPVGGIVTGRLHQVHGLRFPSVLFARPTRFVKAADGQNVGAALPALCVHVF